MIPERADTRAQTFLLPPSVDERTQLEHPARFLAAFGVCTTTTEGGRIVTLTAHDAVVQAHRQEMLVPERQRVGATRAFD